MSGKGASSWSSTNQPFTMNMGNQLRRREVSVTRKTGADSYYFLSDESDQSTFGADSSLPSLPLPTLHHTFDRFIDSCRPLVSDLELQSVLEEVNKFVKGEGLVLDKELRKRACTSKNWLEQWWEQGAYLQLREPLIPYYSMTGSTSLDDLFWDMSEGQQAKRAALYAYYLSKFWLMLRKEKVIPSQTTDRKTIFSMNQFRRLFNCTRIPGIGCDTLATHFRTEKEGDCPSHVIVLCRGRFFRIDALNQKSGLLLLPHEWEILLDDVLNRCNTEISDNDNLGPAILTCDNRDNWAKNRMYLSSLSPRNKDSLSQIEEAMFVIILDNGRPDKLESEVSKEVLCGDFNNRWADKSLCFICFANGTVGALSDHTAYDGLVSVIAMHYVYLSIRENKGRWTFSEISEGNTSLNPTNELIFDIDAALNQKFQETHTALQPHHDMVCVAFSRFTQFGKEYVQSHQLHPDSFFQMALQLGYYRLHQKFAPTYETATTRSFYNGRTETVRSCTKEAAAWVVAMMNESSSTDQRISLLRTAIERHDELMSEARNNAGCDRHLFGLYCMALEMGKNIPSLFSHPAYVKSGGGGNFVLSTSCVGFTPMGGTVAPMCLDGYGCFYCILPEKYQFSVSVWRNSAETSAWKFVESVNEALKSMYMLLGPAPSKQISDNDFVKRLPVPMAKL